MPRSRQRQEPKAPPPEEEFRKERARRRLLDFVTYTKPDYEVNWHHEVICRELDGLLRGPASRLILCMPPRFGKSELVSRRLPAFILGRDPDARIIACSYSADLAQAMNRDVQRIIDDPRYRELFPGTALPRSNVRTISGSALRNSNIFEVVGRRGMYLSAGVGGGITGRGFDLGIIDDPIKNRVEANSSTFRERLWDWYRSTFYTRREKDAKILIVMTRWHEDDLVGRLLELESSGSWRVVCFPAVSEPGGKHAHPEDKRPPGEALWPGKFPLSDLERVKVSLGSYEWAGLYQQAPAPSGGGIFMASWWMSYADGALPRRFDEVIQSWDCAFKGTDASDFVVGQVWARAAETYYLLDQVRERMDFPQTLRAVKNLSVKWPQAQLKLVEDKANGPAVIDMLKRELSGLVAVEPQGGKEARAYAVSALVEAGCVFIPARAPWRDDFIAEVSSFPNGRNDDQVDAMTQALARLARKKGGWSFIGGRT